MGKRAFFYSISLLLLVSCGKELSSRNQHLQKGPEPFAGLICYTGEGPETPLCLGLVDVDAAALKYKDPHTDPSFPYKKGGSALMYWYSQPLKAVSLLEEEQAFKISPDFRVREVMSLQKDNFGIYSRNILEILQDLRSASGGGLRVTSGYRSPIYNEGVLGASKWSRHQYGDAFDIQPIKGQTLQDLKSLCEMRGAYYVSVYQTHVHCDWRSSELDSLFYGVISIPTDRESFQTQLLKKQTQKAYKESSQIRIYGLIQQGETLELSSESLLKEDGDILYHQWAVTDPSGEVLKSVEAVFALKLSERGKYRIHLTLGDHVVLEKTLKVK